MLLSVITVDDVLVFSVPHELARYNTQQTTAGLTRNTSAPVFVFCSSASVLYDVASSLQLAGRKLRSQADAEGVSFSCFGLELFTMGMKTMKR